jgi:hypothetical protein
MNARKLVDFRGSYHCCYQPSKASRLIGEDPAEFVETVRKSSEPARRPVTISGIQRVNSVRTLNGKA